MTGSVVSISPSVDEVTITKSGGNVISVKDNSIGDTQLQGSLPLPFGSGADGALSITSGTTNLTQGTIYQYSSISISAGATLSCASTSEKPLIIYCSGNATINGTIALNGKGAFGSGSIDGYALMGAIGTGVANNFGIGTTGQHGNDGGNKGYKGMDSWNFQQNQCGFVMNGCSGADAQGAGAGSGGAGGATLVLIVGGDLTFGASSAINTSGSNGGNGTPGAGGGGGGAGDILIFYKGTLTDGGVTKTKNGGSGGTGVASTGGGGGASSSTNGASASGATGGAGGAGFEKIVAYNTIFWGGLPVT